MEPYKNLGGKSGVVAYKVGDNYIQVRFKSGQWTLYTYTYQSAGSTSIEMMKGLARRGQGLNSYISTSNPKYTSKS